MTHHKNYSIISNTQIERERPSADDRVTTTFQTTPMMPTYNLAILVSDFSRVTNNTRNHSVYFPSNVKSYRADFALQLGDRLLKEYEDYTNIPYGIGKMDLVAVPGYTGALENWGSIFFR